MVIGDRLRSMRQQQKLSQGDVEAQTGVPEYYISSVEEGKTIPDIETLEKLACALEIPLSSFFYDAQTIPCLPNLSGRLTADDIAGVRSSERPRKKHAEASWKSDNEPDGGSARR
jgi:transcriptional regulator with XRE-family HTH domain